MKNVSFYLTFILLSCISPVLKGQVVLFTYSYDLFLNDPEPGALTPPTFTIQGTLNSPDPGFVTGAPPASCTQTTGYGALTNSAWNTGDAYRYEVDATGFENMGFAFCGRGSSAGINNFLCRTSCDNGTNWTTIVPTFNPPFGTVYGAYSGSIPIECDEASVLWIEIYKVDEPSAPSASGRTFRIDNVTLAGYVVLPIELADFSATEENGKVALNWTTASETNNEYFSVQRSHDGLNFYEIGKLEAAGNSTTATDYNFTDDNPLPGINYYRLHQVDFDGKSSNSPVKSLDFGSNATLSLFPSVTSGEINVLMNDTRVQLVNARVEVYDMVGQLLKSVPYRENLKLDVNDLTEGTYFVRLTDNQLVFSGNFIKI